MYFLCIRPQIKTCLSVLERRGSSRGGGAQPLHPPPRSAPGLRGRTWAKPSTIIIENLSLIFITVCKVYNSTGNLTDCSFDCCQGDLCNKLPDTTTKPEPASKAFGIGCKPWSHFVCSCPERVCLTLYPCFVLFFEKCKQMFSVWVWMHSFTCFQ